MFPLTVNTSKTLLSTSFLTHHLHPPIPLPLHLHSSTPPLSKPISATITSSSSQNPPQQQLHYQPFRPPPSPLPTKYRSLDTNGRLEILANRLGLWFEYAPIIPSLTQEGFSPSNIEELTGISGVEQNRIIVAAQVRDTLIQSNTDSDIISFFDNGGAEILYEIRLLSATQRAAAVRFAVDNKLDGKGARELARSVKDFPRRRGDRGWTNFDYNLPEDCLSFMYYRQAQEHRNPSEQRTAALKQALQVAGSEAAKNWILKELEGGGDRKSEEEVDDDGVTGVRVPVVRMQFGEVAECTTVVVLPVCKAAEAVVDAPWECGTEGEFGVVVAEKGWNRWVVFPGWEPIVGLRRGGVVMAFSDSRVLPWKANKWYKEEPILVVADRTRNQVAANDGFYLVACNDDGGLKVERGSTLKEKGVTESLGTVLLVVRPPRENSDDQQLDDEDWE